MDLNQLSPKTAYDMLFPLRSLYLLDCRASKYKQKRQNFILPGLMVVITTITSLNICLPSYQIRLVCAFFKVILFIIYFWSCWVFVTVSGLSLVTTLGPSHCSAFSCCRACGILPDQRSNPCPPHWQADS